MMRTNVDALSLSLVCNPVTGWPVAVISCHSLTTSSSPPHLSYFTLLTAQHATRECECTHSFALTAYGVCTHIRSRNPHITTYVPKVGMYICCVYTIGENTKWRLLRTCILILHVAVCSCALHRFLVKYCTFCVCTSFAVHAALS